MSDEVLTIDLAGDRRVLEQEEVLTFGRAADLVIDEANPYLHRVVGRFFWQGGSWWLENLGSFIELEVVLDDGTSSRLPPTGPESTPIVHALPPSGFQVLFESGETSYVLNGSVGAGAGHDGPTGGDTVAVPDFAAALDVLAGERSAPDGGGTGGAPDPFGGAPAVLEPEPSGAAAPDWAPPPLAPEPDYDLRQPPAPPAPPEMPAAAFAAPGGSGTVVLAPGERQLLAALAEPLLQDPGVGIEALLPESYLAERLGWPVSKLNRKLDYLCSRLTRAGVRGLYGPSARRSMGDERRWWLAKHAVATGMVTPADL